MEIKGYTLHGDYYLADKVIPNKTWKQALEMKEVVVLPNGKKVIARLLSKEELETIPREEKKCDAWYWSSTPFDSIDAWYVNTYGVFYSDYYNCILVGARLGFKNPF